jgi:4-aminobutyrate aminotransferase
MKTMPIETDSKQNLSPVWSRIFSIEVDRGEGCYLIDIHGNKYLDFTCGIGVTNTGHCHPKVVEAIRKQAGMLIHGQANIVIHKPMLELISELKTVVNPTLDGYFFTNSGAEAVEGAIKLARHATSRPNIIVFQGSFHGRTVGAMSLTTSKTVYRTGYQPLMAGVFVAPYPYSYRYGWNDEQTTQWCLDELEFLFLSQTAPQETAAILIEPVLGEGGYVVPPAGFLGCIRELCDKHGIMLIVDEIQSGFGRTGRWFAQEHFKIVPDIMTVAKGIASGLPLSGVFSRLDLMKRWQTGTHGGTFGGNVIACAAGVATIKAMRDEKMPENARVRGEQLMNQLRRTQLDFPVIGDVRGLGLMIGVEFRTQDRKPDKTTTKAIVQACFDRKLMLLTCGTFDNVIRWIPPLVVTEKQVDEAVDIFIDALKSVVNK